MLFKSCRIATQHLSKKDRRVSGQPAYYLPILFVISLVCLQIYHQSFVSLHPILFCWWIFSFPISWLCLMISSFVALRIHFLPMDYLTSFSVVAIFFDTFIIADLVDVKYRHIGMLWLLSISFTHFMLCSITGFHLVSHFLSCWFVSSNLTSVGPLNIFNSSSSSTISLIVYRCVIFFDKESYSATILPPTTGVVLSMHCSFHNSACYDSYNRVT